MSYANANQNRLNFVSNYASQRSWTVLDYVLATSDANTRMTIDSDSLLFGAGKLRKAVINYFPASCDVVGECGQGLCADGTTIEPKQEIFELTKCFSSKKWTLRAEDIRLLDTGEWEFTSTGREYINSYMPQLRKELAKQWYSEITMLAGTHQDGSEYGAQKLKFVNLETGVVNPVGRLSVDTEYEELGFQAPYVLGGKDIKYWQQMVNIGGLNNNGQEVGMVDTDVAWYDQGIGKSVLNDIVNGDHVLTIDPQMFKYVTYSKNAGIFRGGVTGFDEFADMRGTFSPTWGRTTWLDAQTGILWDLYIRYEECDDVWTWHVEHHYDFFVMPPIECVNEGINGIMKWRTCPEVITDCPTGSPITSPSNGTLYSVTPGDIFPFTAYNATIGGIDTEPNTTVSDIAGMVAMMNANYVRDIFFVNGSDIEYTGFTALSYNLNDGAITGTFS